MTHLYTVLTGGLVLPAADEPGVTAIAWAGDTVIGLGTDEAMRGLTRGDSWFVDLMGASVVPLGDGDPAWPVSATLEVGGHADLAILTTDPRLLHGPVARSSVVAVIRDGRVVAGGLPGGGGGSHEAEHVPGESPVSPG